MAQLIGNILANYTPSNPFRQPAFAVWSNQNAHGGFSIIDHNYNCIGRFMYSNSGSGQSAMTSTGAPELAENGNSINVTSSQASNTANLAVGCNNVGYLGHINFSIDDGITGDPVGQSGKNYRAVAFKDNGTIVGEIDQSYAIWYNDRYFIVGPRSANWYYTNTIGNNYGKVSVSNKNSGYTYATYGTVSYNAKTNMLCIIEADDSNNWKPTVYSNVPKLNKFIDNQFNGMTDQSAIRSYNTSSNLYNAFDNPSNYTVYNVATGKPSTNSDEDRRRCIPVMCDNKKIVMFQMIPTSYGWVHRWGVTGAAEGLVCSMTLSTTYGYTQGNQYGARYVVSSDGRYVLAYCPYYYYGAGCVCALIRVSDGKVLMDYNTDTSAAYHFAPIGKSNFICQYGDNADGSSLLYTKHIDSNALMYTSADAQRVEMVRNFSSQMIGTNQYTADYPCIIPLQYDTKALCNL